MGVARLKGVAQRASPLQGVHVLQGVQDEVHDQGAVQHCSEARECVCV